MIINTKSRIMSEELRFLYPNYEPLLQMVLLLSIVIIFTSNGAIISNLFAYISMIIITVSFIRRVDSLSRYISQIVKSWSENLPGIMIVLLIVEMISVSGVINNIILSAFIGGIIGSIIISIIRILKDEYIIEIFINYDNRRGYWVHSNVMKFYDDGYVVRIKKSETQDSIDVLEYVTAKAIPNEQVPDSLKNKISQAVDEYFTKG